MAADHAQFSSLPSELRSEIHHLAVDRSLRIVEGEAHERRVVSETRPPALPHVHRGSRAFVLDIYKPWLPQFFGRPAHAPYAALLTKYRPSKILGHKAVFCLNDVCFDMEHNTRLCKIRGPRLLYISGCIEECCLKKLPVYVDGWLRFWSVGEELRKAKSLDILYLVQDSHSDGIYYKTGRIFHRLERSAEKGRVKPKVRLPSYVPPRTYPAITSNLRPSRVPNSEPPKDSRRGILLTPHVEPIAEPSRHASTWATYKYSACSTPALTRPSMEPQCNLMQQPNSEKRKKDTAPEAIVTGEGKLSERAKNIKLWTRAQDRRKTQDAKDRPQFADPFEMHSMNEELRGFTSHSLNQASPSTGQASSRADPQSETSSQQSQGPPSDKESLPDESADSEGEDSEPSDSESKGSRSESPDLQDAEDAVPERRPKQLHAHRFNFDINATELLVEWNDSPEMDTWGWVPKDDLLLDIPIMIANFLSNNLSLEAGTPVHFHERNSGSVGFDFLVEFEGYPEEIYWTWVPESNMQAKVPDMVDEWMAENASEFEAGGNEETVEDQILHEQNHAENIRAEDEDNQLDESTEVADAGEADVKEAEGDAGDEESSTKYTPKRFVTQRDTPDGPEILVEWEGWPDEKDWTWEPERNLLEDTPELVKAWKASRKGKNISKVYEVDSILGKRKVRGEWKYVVRWKGFSKDEATSLEPCEKFRIDVPDLVEAFESHRPKRGRPKKANPK